MYLFRLVALAHLVLRSPRTTGSRPARRLFDGMPESFKKTAAAAGGEDRIGAFPDELLQRVLAFLPSREAVRTCVLARRWRHQWKSVPSLRIATNADSYKSAHALNKFVNYLLLLREQGAPLYECEINSYAGRDRDEAFRYIELWLRYAVSRQVRVLQVHVSHVNVDEGVRLPNVALVSQHLKRLELCGVKLADRSLDFSSCPALEVLKMKDCGINAEKILSQSLRRLSITGCFFFLNIRTHISAPNLISLELADFWGWTPMLESMPSLVTTFARLGDFCDDYCFNDPYGDCGDTLCDGYYCNDSNAVHDDDCVLLDGLSDATNLELITGTQVVCLHLR